jgi:hypothetical protein
MKTDFQSHKKYKKLARRLGENASAKAYKTFRLKLPPLSSKAEFRSTAKLLDPIIESQKAKKPLPETSGKTDDPQKPLPDPTTISNS